MIFEQYFKAYKTIIKNSINRYSNWVDCIFLRLNFGYKKMERMTGVGPPSQAWEARVLPMYYIRKTTIILYFDLIFVNF